MHHIILLPQRSLPVTFSYEATGQHQCPRLLGPCPFSHSQGFTQNGGLTLCPTRDNVRLTSRRSLGQPSLDRLLKNAHLRRFPHPSPCQARGRLVAAYIQVRLTPQDIGRPRKRDFADSTCICLPAEALAQAGAFLISLKK